MCKCNPEIKTPFCGTPGCEWPEKTKPADPDATDLLESLDLLADLCAHWSRNRENGRIPRAVLRAILASSKEIVDIAGRCGHS